MSAQLILALVASAEEQEGKTHCSSYHPAYYQALERVPGCSFAQWHLMVLGRAGSRCLTTAGSRPASRRPATAGYAQTPETQRRFRISTFSNGLQSG